MTNNPEREWTSDFANFPTDGTRVELRREDCPGYDTTGAFKGGRLDAASFFIRPHRHVGSDAPNPLEAFAMTNNPVADLVALNDCIEMVDELYDSVLASKARQELARLTAERDQALARAAAAAISMRSRAADYVQSHNQSGVNYNWSGMAETIRALPIDPDAQKALDKMLAEAREDAIREAANIVNKNRDISGWVSHDAILALLNDGGRDE